MSGGVGPSNDISLPEEEEEQPQPEKQSRVGSPPGRRRILGFRHLNCLALMIVLTGSGMISPLDIGFVIFSSLYLLFLSRVSFPSLGPGKEPTVFDPNNRILKGYVLFAAVIGLLLPIVYMVEGIWEGDKEGIAAAAPHLFLLASQVFMEGWAFSPLFSTPIRVFVPVFYNSRRIISLVEWLDSEFGKVDDGGYSGSKRRLYVGRGLAIANMALWSFNLFGFLLPVYLPAAFKKYYSAVNKTE